MKEDLDIKKYPSIIQVTIFMFCISSVCMAGVVEFTDETTFKNAVGEPNYLIDFESYGDGNSVVGEPTISGNEWSNLGIQFAAVESGESLSLNTSASVSPTHSLIVSGDESSYVITFTQAVVSFGIYFVDSDYTSTSEQIILKDSGGNPLGVFPIPPSPANSSAFRGYASDIPIAEVLIIEDADGEAVLLDDVMWTHCAEFNDVNDFKAVIGGEPDYKIDFETYGDGSPVVGEPIVDGNEWSNLGIQFAEMEIGFSMILSEKAGMAVSPTHALATAGLSPGNDRSSRLITFSTPVITFGAYIVDNETTSTAEKIILKDKYGNPIKEFPMPVGPALSKDFRGYLSSVPIAEVHILEANDGEGALLDDVMYSVPILISIPNGGEVFNSGTSQTIEWSSSAPADANVKIEYSINNGTDWNDVNNSVPNTGSYDWTVPEVTSPNCLVRISDVNDANIYDTSDDVFTIFVCQLLSRADLNDDCKVDFADFSLFALDWLRNGNPFAPEYSEDPLGMVFVSISEPNFAGLMSKYETTNTQYCQFLNDALNDGLISVLNDIVVYDTSDTSYSEPFFNTHNGDSDSQITYNGDNFTVNPPRNGYDMNEHPVVEVSFYGAEAFCNYYGYRLPTEDEWEAVADYDGSFIYGCGTTIDHSKANYDNGNPLSLTSFPYTSPVSYYGAYGYGFCDMSGNAKEWTTSVSGAYQVLRGGSWGHAAPDCTVSVQDYNYKSDRHYNTGFRVVLSID
ncbi:MAG: SUMF1/EgtB/PvdO family nonheme iron enzyme [Planctomycetota bacterium]